MDRFLMIRSTNKQRLPAKIAC